MSAARAKDVFHVQLDVLKPTSCGGCGLCCLGIGSPPLYYVTYPHVQGPHPFRPADLPQHLIDEIDEKFLGVFRGRSRRTPAFGTTRRRGCAATTSGVRRCAAITTWGGGSACRCARRG